MHSTKLTNTKHVYIIDDDKPVRIALMRGLERLGYDVYHFESARAFLDQSIVFRPAVLILDMQMPGMTGVELQAWLNEKNSKLPTIFISGESTVAQGITAMKQGAWDFLAKPFNLDQLTNLIETAIKHDERIVHITSIQQQCANRLQLLSHRELDAYHCFAKGYSHSQVMAALEISLPTAKTYRAAVMRKLKCSSLAELISFDKQLKGITG